MATTKQAPAQTEGDEADTAAGSENRESKKSSAKSWLSAKLIAIAAAALLGLGSAGGGAYYVLASHSERAVAGAIKPPVFFNMPEVLVNLSTSGNAPTQYLKVDVVLELPSEAMKAQIQMLMPRLMDTFQTYLRELRATDLNGSAGLYRLKEELTRRVNAEIAPDKVNAVLFKEIVVQ